MIQVCHDGPGGIVHIDETGRHIMRWIDFHKKECRGNHFSSFFVSHRLGHGDDFLRRGIARNGVFVLHRHGSLLLALLCSIKRTTWWFYSYVIGDWCGASVPIKKDDFYWLQVLASLIAARAGT
eukprot:scaffold43962_cov47-Attheya_sp.AAC.3